MKLSLLVYAKMLELAAVGGSSYLADPRGILLSTAGFRPMSSDGIQAAELALHFANATAAGASVPATVAAKVLVAKCLQCADIYELQLASLLLDCQLGRAKAYPQ